MLRQEVVWVDSTKKVSLEKNPFRVWTLLRENDKMNPPKLPISPVHLQNAFLEENIHDYRYRNGTLRYSSRVVDDCVWILVEYE